MGSRPKKRFAQHFLADKNIARKIVDLLEITPEDKILEIGSGRGTLTGIIAAQAGALFTFEIDRDLMQNLEKKFRDNPRVGVIQKDFLKIAPEDYIDGPYKLIGNIPYDITSPLLEWITRHRKNLIRAVITSQKEFAERIAADPGTKNWAPLSIFCQSRFDIKVAFDISPKSFYPPPKINSSCLIIEPKDKYDIPDDNLFESVVRQSFTQRRKQLVNNLGDHPGLTKDTVHNILNDLGLRQDIRAEHLSIQDFLNLTEKIKATVKY